MEVQKRNTSGNTEKKTRLEGEKTPTEDCKRNKRDILVIPSTIGERMTAI